MSQNSHVYGQPLENWTLARKYSDIETSSYAGIGNEASGRRSCVVTTSWRPGRPSSPSKNSMSRSVASPSSPTCTKSTSGYVSGQPDAEGPPSATAPACMRPAHDVLDVGALHVHS